VNTTPGQVTEGFLTVPVFAEAVEVKEVTVLRWVREGKLPSIKLGRRILIPVDALKRMLERAEQSDGA
jgi:excisionase family DNA binding protein